MNADAAGPEKAREQAREQARGQPPGQAPGDVPEQAVQAEVHVARQEVARNEEAGQALADRAQPDKRERIVLAKQRSSRRVVRTLDEVEDLTPVGKTLLFRLMESQLRLSMRLILLIAVVLASIPLAFLLAPSLATTTILGLRLPWLLLGVAVYPFFVAVAWFYTRSAESTDQDFAEWVKN